MLYYAISMSFFKPFDGMQKPPEGPPPSQEALRLKDALKRTIAEVRKLEGQVQTLAGGREAQSE